MRRHGLRESKRKERQKTKRDTWKGILRSYLRSISRSLKDWKLCEIEESEELKMGRFLARLYNEILKKIEVYLNLTFDEACELSIYQTWQPKEENQGNLIFLWSKFQKPTFSNDPCSFLKSNPFKENPNLPKRNIHFEKDKGKTVSGSGGICDIVYVNPVIYYVNIIF